jgi:hypothetical protein
MRKRDLIKLKRKAGSVSSPAKAAAVRENGKLGAAHGIKGGRPANPEIKRIMDERGCSRQRAHVIFFKRNSTIINSSYFWISASCA